MEKIRNLAVVPFSCHQVINPILFKTHLLYFDAIATTLSFGRPEGFVFDYINEDLIHWLKAKGLMIFLDITSYETEELKKNEEYKNYRRTVLNIINKLDQTKAESFLSYYSMLSRFDSYILKENDISAYPLLSISDYKYKSANSKKTQIIQVVINKLPVLDNRTSWDQLLEFRNDPESRNKFLALKNWINDLSRTDLSAIEIEEKIEFLINEYQNHIAFHKLKTTHGKLEVITKFTLEIIENLAKFKFSKIADTLFSINKKNIEIMEAEMKAPGRELAYIVKALNEFS